MSEYSSLEECLLRKMQIQNMHIEIIGIRI